jgi:hypothetical protein
VDLDDSETDKESSNLIPSTKSDYITRLLTSEFSTFPSGKISPKRPSSEMTSSPLSVSKFARPSTRDSDAAALKNSHLNLEMLNYPFPTSLSPNTQFNSPLITSNNNNNHILNSQSRKIAELELQLTQTKVKTAELARYVQFLQARLILSERASEEKEQILKQKDKTIDALRLELERREQIFRAYGLGNVAQGNKPKVNSLDGATCSQIALASNCKSPGQSGGSSIDSNSSSQRTGEIPPHPSASTAWK